MLVNKVPVAVIALSPYRYADNAATSRTSRVIPFLCVGPPLTLLTISLSSFLVAFGAFCSSFDLAVPFIGLNVAILPGLCESFLRISTVVTHPFNLLTTPITCWLDLVHGSLASKHFCRCRIPVLPAFLKI